MYWLVSCTKSPPVFQHQTPVKKISGNFCWMQTNSQNNLIQLKKHTIKMTLIFGV